MESNGKVKGAMLLARLRFVRSFGGEMARRVLAALEPEARSTLDERTLLPTSWYAAELVQRLDDAIASQVGGGNREAVRVALGQFTAEASLGPTGSLRAFAGQGDPHLLLREVPRLHPALHGAGQRGYARLGARAALLRAVQGHRNGSGECLTNLGWLKRAIEICGGRDVQVSETGCVGRGGACCEFRCEWR